MATAQKPIELIMARTLMASLSTPAFLVDNAGVLVFYNEAAGDLLGVDFENAGRMEPEEWSSRFGPFDDGGNPVPFEQLPLTIALRDGRPAHSRLTIQSVDAQRHEIEVSAFPIVAATGARGALAIFWQTGNGK